MSAIGIVLDEIGRLKGQVWVIEEKINQVAGVLLAEKAGLEEQVKVLTETAKSKAEYIPVDKRHTLRGSTYQLVYKPTSKWNDARLKGLAEKYGIPEDELQGCADHGHTWALVKNGKR